MYKLKFIGIQSTKDHTVLFDYQYWLQLPVGKQYTTHAYTKPHQKCKCHKETDKNEE